ncbi:glycosyltransferase [Neobacillus sp. YIM B06451]|uniref:glycosyltransferase family 2 protein n=1 Tax=Neobacillus sp. YIM B06451 TaxID=3070994 RepID=UPI00292ED0F7|nr:glycosyltransferase [Neobacillus sp. YIM B06451]
MDKILVSICCITYNHEKFIADAINSFLMQSTTFNFEILIHDDASTDKTVDIIKGFEEKFPNVIKPIYQTENQYSRGIHVENINVDRAKGKYIAFCEGDDYWTDPYKLQKQVEFMEKHPECSLCVHAGNVVSAADKKYIKDSRPSKKNKVYSTEEIIEFGGGLFLSNSMLYRRNLDLISPEFFLNAPVGDYPLAINLSLQGTVYYMDEKMSAYRVGDSGSWTVNNFSSIDKKIRHFERITIMLDQLDHYTNFKYEEVIIRTKKRIKFYLLLEQKKFKEALRAEFKFIYSRFAYKDRMRLYLQGYFPRILVSLITVKRILKI